MFVAFAGLAHAEEIWVAPTTQQDLGGLGIASSAVWQAAGPSTLHVFVCSSQNGEAASGNCAGPSSKAFVGVTNQLMEVEIAASSVRTSGSPAFSSDVRRP